VKSDDMLDQTPIEEAYADIENFVGGGSPETVPQGDFSVETKVPVPEGEVGEATPKSINLGPGSVEVTDEAALDREAERIKEQLKMLEMAPEQAYLKRLELEGIALSEARAIIDTVMVQLQQYRERVSLTKSLSVELQTRVAKDQAILANIVEARQPRYNMTFDYIVQVQNVAASLVRYGPTEFKRETKEDLGKIVDWLEDLPLPIFYMLVQRLRDFDQKVSVVFQEGYLENF